jgi:hypothetical protein
MDVHEEQQSAMVLKDYATLQQYVMQAHDLATPGNSAVAGAIYVRHVAPEDETTWITGWYQHMPVSDLANDAALEYATSYSSTTNN